ncbi:MAG: hypothetical protein M1832_001295 [Thelocarpon impressellum]|nr:MAG: hypothetical protein M1832_001295 [Thelocarpon impressellum]
MNITTAASPYTQPSAYEQVVDEVPRLLAVLLVPTALLYAAFYVRLKGYHGAYAVLTFASIAGYIACPWWSPIQCGPFKSVQNFAIAIASMKLLDIFARRNSMPQYSAPGPRPSDWLLTLIVLTELRYESFTPNHIRVGREAEGFSEPVQLAVHTAIFAVLQAMPQHYPVVLAFEVLLAIYIIWTSIQLVLRYKSSPSLFGPLYMAHSLSGFWSETWHNAFASPCESLAYRPLRHGLARLGVSAKVARSAGILGAFVLMAAFHVYALEPLLPRRSTVRIGLFFLLNGVGTVVEGAIWGRRRHWAKTALAWVFEIWLASWTAEVAHIPKGLGKIAWHEICMPVAAY